MPASLTTRSEPRPTRKRGRSRAAGVAHDAAQLEEVASLREEVGRSAHAHRGVRRQRLVAGGPDAQPTGDVRAGGLLLRAVRRVALVLRPERSPRRRRACSRCLSRAPLDGLARRAAAARSASATSRSAVAAAAPGRPRERDAAAMTGRSGPVSRSAAWRNRVAVEILVGHEPGGAGLHQLGGVGALVRRGVRVGHDDHGQAGRRGLGQGRGAGAAHEQVGRRQRGGHVLVQEGEGPVALAAVVRQRSLAAPRPGRTSRGR